MSLSKCQAVCTQADAPCFAGGTTDAAIVAATNAVAAFVAITDQLKTQ
jgi:hypothetical protein